MDLVERARDYAAAAHRGVGQLRKYTGQPYEEHLRRVADIVATVTKDPEMIAAAWLHDVVEDTPTTIEDIEREFGRSVRELVDALTDVSRPHHGNRAARKGIDRDHLAGAPARAQTVKLADLIDNCDDICKHAPGFGRVFLKEMAGLLDVLDAGDPKLKQRARNVHERWTQRLTRVAPASPAAPAKMPTGIGLSEDRVRRVLDYFVNAFRAHDIADPLPDGEAVDAASHPATRIVPHDASPADLVAALDRHDSCYVTLDGRITGIVRRAHMQGPIVRMWLFGMVTTIEWLVTEEIRAAGESFDWEGRISPARLSKAQGLRDSRGANGREVALLDCLQLADKVRIYLALDEGVRPLFRGATKNESQRLVKDLENLRNSLAHAQDIVTHDWSQIARLARRLDELVGTPSA